jgi:hypothetical protein
MVIPKSGEATEAHLRRRRNSADPPPARGCPHERISALMTPRVIVVPQAAAMDAGDFFVLLISCSALRACVSLARGTVLQRNFESPIYDSLRIGVAAPTSIMAQPGLDA